MTFKEKILFSVATFKGWQRYAATLILLCIMVSAWWFFSYQKIYNALRQAQHYTVVQQAAHAVVAGEEIALAQDSFAWCPGVAEELNALTLAQTYEKRRASFFVQKTLSAFEDELLNIREKCQFGLIKVHLEMSPVRKDWYCYAKIKDASSCALQKHKDRKKLMGFLKSFELLDNVHIERCHITMLPNAHVEVACVFGLYLPI